MREGEKSERSRHMGKNKFLSVVLAVMLLGQSALAESSDYHLKRLEIQARAFLALMGSDMDVANPVEQTPPAPELVPANGTENEVGDNETRVNQQLSEAVAAPTWAENMVREDIMSLLSTSETLRNQLQNSDSEEYLRAKVELESLARRLRISTAPLALEPQQKAALDLMMLELDEATTAMTNTREALIARKENSRRQRSRASFGVGYGWGGFGSPWGGWASPWGYYGAYSPYFGGGFYRPYRRYYRRGCR